MIFSVSIQDKYLNFFGEESSNQSMQLLYFDRLSHGKVSYLGNYISLLYFLNEKYISSSRA